MTKEILTAFVASCKAAGATIFSIRCQGGNRICTDGNESGKIIFGDTSVVTLETSNNNANSNSRFTVSTFDYGLVDSVYVDNLTTQQTISLLTGMGMCNQDANNFIALNGSRIVQKPGNAGLAVSVDSDGNPTLNSNISATITT